MATDDILVVFDPVVLARSLSESGCAAWQALDTLIQFCSNKLIVDDGSERFLQSDDYLKRRLDTLLPLLQAKVPIDKRKMRGRRHAVGDTGGLPNQHRDYFLRALTMRPIYLVAQVAQWMSRDLARRLRQDLRVAIVGPDEYIRRTRGNG